MRFMMFLVLAVTAMSTNAVESLHRMTITHPIEIKAGGSIDEALTLAKTWRTQVIDKIPHVLKSEFLLEKQSETKYELLVIYHFKDLKGELESIPMMGPLILKAWPDEKKRMEFFTKMRSYVAEDKKVTRVYSLIK